MSYQYKRRGIVGLLAIVGLMLAVLSITPPNATACVLYGIIGDDAPNYKFPDGLLYNNLVLDFNETRLFGALLYGRQSHGWGVARYDQWGATDTAGDLHFYRDINKPADCQWSGNTFLGCSAVDQDFLDMAHELDQVKPKVVLVHWRTGSSGCSGATHLDVHPFFEDYDGKTWSFVQNGGVDKPRTKWLIVDGNSNPENNDWTNDIPDGSGVEGCTSDRSVDPYGDDISLMVDSELYFKLIMKHIKEAHAAKRSTLDGIVEAIIRLVNHGETGGINFIMSDGYTMWAYKRGNILSYRYNPSSGFTDVATNQLTGYKLNVFPSGDPANPPVVVPSGFNNDGWVSLNDYEIVIAKPGEPPVVKDVRELVPGNLTCGDPNNAALCDSVVDDRDYAILVNALGTCTGNPNFVERADLNKDGCITKQDEKIWQADYNQFITTMLCDDHMNSAMGCCRDGYIYDKYDVLCGATYLPLTGATGTIDPSRDVDYFQFYAFKDHSYTLATSNSITDLYLYDSDGRTQIARADTIDWTCPVTGTYYSMVYASSAGRNYGLSLTTPGVITVDIDIKPGDAGDVIDNNGRGVIPVAILSKPGFDARTVDPSTVRLNNMVVKSNAQGKFLAQIADVNGDGLKDMVVQFEDTVGAFQKYNTQAELVGMLVNGTIFRGVDSINIVGSE
jgi:hypothetical protein